MRRLQLICSAIGAAVVAYLLSNQWLETNAPLQHAREAQFQRDLSAVLDDAVQRFSKALTFRTVAAASRDDVEVFSEALNGLRRHLQQSFPLLWQTCEVSEVNTHSLLIKLEGTDPNLKALLSISHQDVVPAGCDTDWTHPPFQGKVADGYIWGRGAIDLKATLMAQLEALTLLLQDKWRPRRTLLLAYGHDEEVGGRQGAAEIAKILRSQGTQLDFVLDEGGALLVDGLPPFLRAPLALVGTAEKGKMTVEVEANGTGGHGSMPPAARDMAIMKLAAALQSISSRMPPPRLTEPTIGLLKAIGAASPHAVRWLLSRCDVWPVSWLASAYLGSRGGELGAMVRTTYAPATLATRPSAPNVVPAYAAARLDVRLLPGESPEAVVTAIAHAAGPSVQVAAGAWDQPNAVAPAGGRGFTLVADAARATLASGMDVTVAPFLLVGGTDSKHYTDLADGHVLRFMPLALNRSAGDLRRIHAVDERLSVGAYASAMRFYIRFFETALAS